MNWSTCWISREARILHSVVPMISSTFQRSPWKTCGLFDSGFAGDVDFITSTGLNAPVAAIDDYDPLSGLGPDSQQGQSLYPSTSGIKESLTTDKQFVNKVDGDSWFDDLDPDLSGDPLGDDSMEAFINLDKFLNGNSFFDEDGNLTVPEENPINQDIGTEDAEVTPVINFASETNKEPTLNQPASFDLLTGVEDQDFLLSPNSTKTMGEKKSSRKRTAGSRDGLTTSLYEIPATSVIPDIIQDSLTTLSDTELDHDYSSKRQRMSPPGGNDNTPSTSGTMRNLTQYHSGITPKTVVVTKTCNDTAQLLDESMDKQTIRRIKNNHASKRSREQRKQKFVEMDMEAEELVSRNQHLREKIVELERLAKEMKAVLVAKMAGKSV